MNEIRDLIRQMIPPPFIRHPKHALDSAAYMPRNKISWDGSSHNSNTSYLR